VELDFVDVESFVDEDDEVKVVDPAAERDDELDEPMEEDVLLGGEELPGEDVLLGAALEPEEYILLDTVEEVEPVEITTELELELATTTGFRLLYIDNRLAPPHYSNQ
jgi:hypothetical protein